MFAGNPRNDIETLEFNISYHLISKGI